MDQKGPVDLVDLVDLEEQQYHLALDSQAILGVLGDQAVLVDLEELAGLVDRMDQVPQVDLGILEV